MAPSGGLRHRRAHGGRARDRHDRPPCRPAGEDRSAAARVGFWIRDAWFWVGGGNRSPDVNRVFVGNPLEIMAHSFGHHFKQAFRRIDPIGSRYPHLLAALALLAVGIWRASKSSGRPAESRPLLILAGLVCVTAILTQWRTDDGFKSVTVFGDRKS